VAQTPLGNVPVFVASIASATSRAGMAAGHVTRTAPSCSPADAKSHDCEAMEDCAAGVLRSFGDVSPKTQQGAWLSS